MTPSQQAKAIGFKSLAQVSELLGTRPNGRPVASTSTLWNWHKKKPKLFRAVLLGCKCLLLSDETS